ncbi:hypothetical protein [Flavobacterium sp. JP2137]|uniref:hypothetical protein n=1 Tax=Flavobacterium sp. JP2137 TaxID=3414510 RepID=UPI003D2FC287
MTLQTPPITPHNRPNLAWSTALMAHWTSVYKTAATNAVPRAPTKASDFSTANFQNPC